MSEYPNSGILNPNKYKRPGTKMPDFNGKAAVTCVHCKGETVFELAAWNRNGRFTTIAFTEKSVADAKRAAYAAKKAGLPVAGEQQENNGTHATDVTHEPEPQDGRIAY